MGSLPPSRREFVQTAAVALSAASYRDVVGANERIGVGMIGYGLIGKRHVLDVRDEPGARITAVAEAHRGRLDEATALIGGGVQGYGDFRRLLDDKNVQAVVVSTPDHWHALQTMLACAAGKDVYVEKPLTLFVKEGRWMIDVAQKHKRIVQAGTQQRSGKHYQRARVLLQQGYLGPISSVRMQSYRNIMPGFGVPADQDPPRDLDWEAFLGPAPQRRYNPNRGIYHFRWFWDYSGGQMTNLAAHCIDILDWVLRPKGPLSVTSIGGRFSLKDNGETPDTQDTLFEYPGFTAIWSHREASRGLPSGSSMEFYGPKGSLSVTRNGFKVHADSQTPPENSIPQFTGAHPIGGPQVVKVDGVPIPWTPPIEDTTGDSREQFKGHIRNWLDCIKTRKEPLSDLASAHRVATACHLANLSLRLGRRLKWDAEREEIVGDLEATRLLVRPYRKPWDAELKALGVS